jgi:hypothetical protein
MLDEARSRGLVDKPLVVSAGETMLGIPRQLGLTARSAIEGIGETAGVFTEPIRMFMNPALRAFGAPAAASTSDMARALADKIGLPAPQNATERVAGDVSRMMAGTGGLIGAARGISSFAASPIVTKTAEALASSPAVQMGAAAGAGAAGGSVREAGGSPGAQFGASLAGGLTGAGATSAGINAYQGISNAIGGLITPKANPQTIEITLNQILSDNGINLGQVPAAVRADLMSEVKAALDTGKDLRPEVVRRIADYAVVGATPTRGSVTLDPVQITQERNLAKLGANSTDPNLQGLARLQNENTGALIRGLNDMGAGRTDSMKAGEAAVGAITGRDATAKAIEKALYARAKDSSGRALELDREGFIFDAYNRLGETNKGAFLPDQIKSLMEQIRTGKTVLPDGTTRPLPFNVDVIDNLKTTLASASRSSTDGNVRAAIAQVRNALEDAQPRAVGRPVGGNQVVDPAALGAAQTTADDASAEAMKAYDRARRFARARRGWQESAEGIQAALNDVPPDRFVKDFILSSGNKAATGEVEKMLATIRKSPEAMQQVKQSVVNYFKSQGMNGAADELRTFSQSGYNKALRDFGDAKLKLFFTSEEITQLKAIGRVASYEQVQPRGAAVNNSNTGAAVGGLLDRIASNKLLARVPFGDVALRQPAANWSAQIGVNNAMNATGAASAKAPVTAQRARLEALMGPALLLASPSANAGNNDKRR